MNAGGQVTVEPFWKRLERIELAFGWQGPELAIACGVHHHTLWLMRCVSHNKPEVRPTREIAAGIAARTGCRAEWVLTGQGESGLRAPVRAVRP